MKKTIVKINEKIKLINLQVDSLRKKGKELKSKKIKNERKHTADTAEMQRMVRDYYN